jgi:hypothetical protein
MNTRGIVHSLWNTNILRLFSPNNVACFVFRKSRVQVSARRQFFLTEVFHGFPQFPRRMSGSYLKIRTRPLPSKSFPIYQSLITLLFDTIYLVLVTEKSSLNLLQTITKYPCWYFWLYIPQSHEDVTVLDWHFKKRQIKSYLRGSLVLHTLEHSRIDQIKCIVSHLQRR